MLLKNHEKYIRRCLEIAKLGSGKVAPNPMVGSVIVHQNKIIGEGWHQSYGGPHAEVNAIDSVIDKSLLASSTIYVSLEPCAHFGNTPPCVDLILKHKIPNVVIATRDPNPKVSGKSIEKLKAAGVNVAYGILEHEALQVDPAFFNSFQKKRPYVILKWAESKDGYFAPFKGQKWLSNDFTKRLTHKWRNEASAILVGKNTVFEDNPKLSDRFWGANNPTRVLIDVSLSINQTYSIFKDTADVIVFNSLKSEKQNHIEHIQINEFPFPIDVMLKHLYDRNITSLLIEGGAASLQHFIKSNLWDIAYTYKTSVALKDGIVAPTISKKNERIVEQISDNQLEIFYNS